MLLISIKKKEKERSSGQQGIDFAYRNKSKLCKIQEFESQLIYQEAILVHKTWTFFF